MNDRVHSKIMVLLENVFKDDEKVAEWLVKSNPCWVNLTPLDMIRTGRSQAVLDYIEEGQLYAGTF